MTIIIKKDHSFPNLLKSNLGERYKKNKRSEYDKIHVSDLLPNNCIRKQFYIRKNNRNDHLSTEDLLNFIRGESSELSITRIASIGVAQNEIIFDDIVAHPDIMNDEMVIELKDSMSGKRLDITDDKYVEYIRQLVYYLVITNIEYGILSIKYNSKEMIWIKRDDEGDYFFRPKNGRPADIESWNVFLPHDDILREVLKNEMMRRKKLLQDAIRDNNVSILPRIKQEKRSIVCSKCVYYDQCMNKDGETELANLMANEIDILQTNGIIEFTNN